MILSFIQMKDYTFVNVTANCSVKDYKIRDQIIIGTTNWTFSKKIIIKNWNLAQLCRKGMNMQLLEKKKLAGR